MSNIQLGAQLHDRATRGEQLTNIEQTTLEAWYAEQDAQEMALLSPAMPTDRPNLEMLQGEIELVLSQLTQITTRIQQIEGQNNQLRHEIALLRHKLPLALAS